MRRTPQPDALTDPCLRPAPFTGALAITRCAPHVASGLWGPVDWDEAFSSELAWLGGHG